MLNTSQMVITPQGAMHRDAARRMGLSGTPFPGTPGLPMSYGPPMGASQTAGVGMPAGTMTPGFYPQGGQFPGAPANGNPNGGYVSPTVNLSRQSQNRSGSSMVSPLAGVAMPAGTITGGIIPPWLRQQLTGQNSQQPMMPDWLSSLGLGNFYTPHGMGDAQNTPIANSTVGGGGSPAPMPTKPVRTIYK